jgi:hypothetical protein
MYSKIDEFWFLEIADRQKLVSVLRSYTGSPG